MFDIAPLALRLSCWMNVTLFQPGLGCLISCPRGPPALPSSCSDARCIPRLLGLHGSAHTPREVQRPRGWSSACLGLLLWLGERTGSLVATGCPGDIPRTASVSRARAGPGTAHPVPLALHPEKSSFGWVPKDLQGQIKVLKSIRAAAATPSVCYLVFTGGGHSR